MRIIKALRERPLIALGLAVGLVAIGVGAYLFSKRPDDISNPDAYFDPGATGETPKKGDQAVDWPTYGLNPERTRYLPSRDLKPPFRVAWRLNGRKLLEYSPIIAGGSLYAINNNGEAFAAKTKTGKVRWRREVASRNASSPAYSDNSLYLANLDPGQVVSLSAKTGKVRWKHPLPGRTESSPVVIGNKVMVGCECGTLFALDKETGKTLWEASLGAEVKAAPAVSDGIAYVGTYGGTMSAIRVADGSIKWQSGSQGGSFGTAGAFYSTAAVAFGRVYAGSKDGRMYSYEKDTGDVAWSHTTNDEIYAAPVAADTPKTPPTIYFASLDGTFYALDARSGDERWSVGLDGEVIGAGSLIGETVYVANLRTTAVDGLNAANGNKVFSFDDGAYNPIVSDGQQLLLTGQKTIYALRPGEPKKPSGGKKPDGR